MEYKSNILEIGEGIFLEGALTVDKLLNNVTANNNLYVTGNVGIGTTSPDAKLHAKSSGNGTYILRGMSSAGTDLGGLFQSTAGDGEIYLKTSAVTTNVRISSNNVSYFNGGNVGIGTTSPAYKLDINGVTRFQDIIRFKATAWQLSDSDSANRLYFSAYGRTYFGSQGGYEWRSAADTALAVITDAGNVGIGTASPTAKLHVQGTSYFFDQSIFGDKVGIGTTSPNYKLDVAGEGKVTGKFRVGGAVMLAEPGTGVLLFGSEGGNQTAIYSASSEVIRINTAGNVGIGTTNPTEKLTVDGNILLTDSLNQERLILFRRNSADVGKLTATALGIQLQALVNKRVAIVDDSNNGMFIVDGGNVGIGTTSPAYKLDVRGTGYFSTAAGTNQLTLGDSTNGKISAIATNNDNLILYPDGSNERVRITAAGNVGIGTTAPSSLLNIVASGSAPSALTVQDNARKVKIGRDQIEVTDLSDTAVTMYLQPNANLVINSSAGNVGIGVQPTQKLHVSGNLRVTGAYYDSNNSAGTSGQVLSSTATGTDWVSLSEIAGVDGTGTANYIAKWSDADTLTNSLLYDNGTNITLGMGSAAASSTSAYGTAQFSVESNLFASSQVFTHNNTSGNYSFFALGKSKGTAAAPTIVESSEIIGAYQFWAYDGSAYREMASIVSNVDGTPGAGDMPGNLRFATTSDGASSPAERMRIAAAGNVGIGTTSPNMMFSVKNLAGITNDGQISWGIGTGFMNWDTGYVSISGQSGTALVLGSNGSERMRITSDGNVGIGTTNPYSGTNVTSLDINATAYPVLALSVGGTNVASLVGYSNSVGLFAKTGNFITLNPNDTEAVRITSAGNVGVGTTSPGIGDGTYKAPLTINSDSSLGTFLAIKNTQATYGMGGVWMQANTGNAGWLFGTDNDGKGVLHYGSGASENDALTDAKDGAKGITIDSSGNVGIGTTSPSAKLHVVGSLRLDNSTGNAPTTNTISGLNEVYGQETVLLGVPDVWIRINIGGTTYVVPGYTEA